MKTRHSSVDTADLSRAQDLSSIAEIVNDVDAAVCFYGGVLGLPVGHSPGAGYATVEMPGVLHFAIRSRELAAEATYGA